MFRSLYSAMKNEGIEPFDSSTNQSSFFQQQNNTFQQPQILPNQISDAGPFLQQNIGNVKDALRMTDPYTGNVSVPFNDAILSSMLKGTPAQSPHVEECRRYIGLSGLEQAILDTSSSINAPFRCGFRYKKSNGLVPEVARGAYGTKNGPVSSDDILGGGITWYWNLQEAKKQFLKDSASALTTCNALTTLPAIQNGIFVGKIAFCKTSRKFIPITSTNTAMYPDDSTLACPTNQIARTVGQCTTTEGFTSQNTSDLDAQCLKAGGSLSRDCLLRAVQMAGCSDKGTLYSALQGSSSSGPYDTVLKDKKAYQDYQSKQQTLGLALNRSIFNNVGNNTTMTMALSEVGKVISAVQSSPSKAIRTAADDLCTRAGIYDTYDFCVDIADSKLLSSLSPSEFTCTQSYWQKKNGKPQGTAYPKKLQDCYSLGPSIRTLGNFKRAVDSLEEQTRSANYTTQQNALLKFTGIQIGDAPVNRIPTDTNTLGTETIWIDRKLPKLCILGRVVSLSSQNRFLPNFPQLTNSLIPFVNKNTNVGFISLFDYKVSGNSDIRLFITTTAKGGFYYSVNKVNINTNSSSTTDTFSRFTNHPSTTDTNLNTSGLLLKANKPNIITTEWYTTTGPYQFTNNLAFKTESINDITPMKPLILLPGNQVLPQIKQNAVLTQESTAPYIALEVCRRNGVIAFQERRLYNNVLKTKWNGNGSYTTNINDHPFVVLRSGHSVVTESKIAFSAFKTISVCFRSPQTNTSAASNIFSWQNLDSGFSSRIGYNATLNSARQVVLEIIGHTQSSVRYVSTRTLPLRLKQNTWYVLVLRIHQTAEQSTTGVTVCIDESSKLQSSGAFTQGQTNFIKSVHPSFFVHYNNNERHCGELRFGTIGNLNLAWFHGFDYVIEDGEQLKREARNGWLRTWFEADL